MGILFTEVSRESYKQRISHLGIFKVRPEASENALIVSRALPT